MLQILNPAKVREGFHFILYGDPKTGKTSTFGDCGLRVLILDLEGGSAVLDGCDNVQRVPIDKWEDMVEVGKSIRQGYFEVKDGDGKWMKVPADYDLYVIDSISRLQEICKEYIALRLAPNRRREILGKFGAQADWGDLRDQLTGMVKAFHSLTKAGDKSVHIGWVAHKKDVKDPVVETKTIATKIQLQGGDTAEIIMSYVDGMFYMMKGPNKDTGDMVYGILTDTMGVNVAGVRQPKKAAKLPKFIENPVWGDIFKQLGYVREGE